jgi:hypothetical protein
MFKAVQTYRQAVAGAGINVVGHSNYLYNLGSALSDWASRKLSPVRMGLGCSARSRRLTWPGQDEAIVLLMEAKENLEMACGMISSSACLVVAEQMAMVLTCGTVSAGRPQAFFNLGNCNMTLATKWLEMRMCRHCIPLSPHRVSRQPGSGAAAAGRSRRGVLGAHAAALPPAI